MSLSPVLRGRRRTLFVRLVLNGIGQAAAGVATVFLVRLAFDHLFTDPDPFPSGRLFWLVGGLATATASIALLRVLERLDAERLGQEYVARVRLRLFDRAAKLPPRALQQHSHGALMLRFVTDLTAIRLWISQGLARLTVASIASSGALFALAFINLTLGLVAFGFVAAAVGVTVTLGPRLRALARENRRRRAQIAANVGEKLTAFSVVQVFGQVKRERRHLARQSRRLVETSVARVRVSALVGALPQAATGIAVGVVFLVGAFEVSAGRASAGTLVATIAIMGLLATPLRDFGRSFVYRANYGVARQKIVDFLNNPSYLAEPRDGLGVELSAGRLSFDQVSVSGGIEDVTLTAEPGSLVVVAGPTGAGKSTALALAARLLDPDEGRVLLDAPRSTLT